VAQALDVAYRSVSNDVATHDAALTRLVLHSPLTPLSVTRFIHPQLLSQLGLLDTQFVDTFGGRAATANSTTAVEPARWR
jgi:hypothetical protein